LRYRADRLESDLARYVPAQYVWNRLEESNLKLILAAIPPATGVVEIVRCNRVELGIRADSSRYAKPSFYAAFVLGHSDQESVKMIDLGDAETIDSAIVAFRKTVSAAHSDRALSSKPDDAADQYSREAGRLRRMVWEPILGALVPGCRRLYLAPDGDLSTVPFELMRDGDGRYAYDDFTISYLATSRDLPRQSEPSAGRASAPLVMADPDFDLDLGAGSAAQQPKTKVQQRDAQSRAWKGRSVRFSALPGSRLEGEQVARLLGVEAKIGKAAVESVLKTARSPRILHIATHGFFLEDQALTGSAESSTRATASVEERLGRLSRLENPLLRSGLALAGANAWLAGRQAADAEDGIVTAEDIAIMDLQNTDLVVLSACDTGLGEIHRGEGVFGLRQAFAFAGAKTLIMSLWKVPDLQTSELMVAMYERLTAGASKIEALRGAQEQVRKEYPHPAAWGAFILLGNPT
jgi:CHAT domain-containing protein